MITSVNNERIKYFVKLKEIKYIKKEGLFLVSSPHIVTEALKAGIVTTVILKEDYANYNGYKHICRTSVVGFRHHRTIYRLNL